MAYIQKLATDEARLNDDLLYSTSGGSGPGEAKQVPDATGEKNARKARRHASEAYRGCTCSTSSRCSLGKATSYPFFAKAIEDAALRIDDSSLEKETKAYALFFLNVAYVDISEGETFDFMLSRIQKDLPVDLQLALGHEGKNVKKRTKLMRKQDRRLRRTLPRGNALNMFMKNLYERPVNVVIQESLKAQKKEEEKKTCLESLRCSSISFPSPSRSSSSRMRISPPSEVTRDPWKSTFNKSLKLSWNGLFSFSPLGVDLLSALSAFKPA